MTRPGHDEARKQLLREGARSYLEATNALIAYQQEVQKKCREVMARYIDDYAAALKTVLKATDIENMAWPTFEQWEGDGCSLGVKIDRKDITGISRSATYRPPS